MDYQTKLEGICLVIGETIMDTMTYWLDFCCIPEMEMAIFSVKKMSALAVKLHQM